MKRRIATTFTIQGIITGAYFALWQAKLLDRGFGVTEIAQVIAIQTGLSFVVEVPTGFLSDHIGPKRMLLLAFALMTLAFALPALTPAAFALAAGVVLFGIADATMNGALDSLANGHIQNDSDDSLLHAYIDREHWAGRGRMAGSVLIPALISILGEPVTGSWWIFTLLAAVTFTLVTQLPEIEKRVVTHSPRAALITSLSATREFVFTKAGFSLLLSALIFGVSDGVTSTSFRPRVVELGISASWLLGFVQLGLTAARLSGLAAYRRAGLIKHPQIAAYSLVGAGALGVLFAFLSQPVAAMAVWFARVAVLSIYFPTSKNLVTQSEYGSTHQASALSVWTLMGMIGTFAWSFAISLSGDAGVPLQWQLVIGGATAVAAGLQIARGREAVRKPSSSMTQSAPN